MDLGTQMHKLMPVKTNRLATPSQCKSLRTFEKLSKPDLGQKIPKYSSRIPHDEVVGSISKRVPCWWAISQKQVAGVCIVRLCVAGFLSKWCVCYCIASSRSGIFGQVSAECLSPSTCWSGRISNICIYLYIPQKMTSTHVFGNPTCLGLAGCGRMSRVEAYWIFDRWQHGRVVPGNPRGTSPANVRSHFGLRFVRFELDL